MPRTALWPPGRGNFESPIQQRRRQATLGAGPAPRKEVGLHQIKPHASSLGKYPQEPLQLSNVPEKGRGLAGNNRMLRGGRRIGRE